MYTKMSDSFLPRYAYTQQCYLVLRYLGHIVPARRWQAHLPDLTASIRVCYYEPNHHLHKMTNTLSLDFKSSALLIALVLVPIITLFGAVAVALACSEYWSCHRARPAWLTCGCCRRSPYKKRRIRSDLENCGGIRRTESSDGPLEYAEPVASHDQV